MSSKYAKNDLKITLKNKEKQEKTSKNELKIW